MAIINKVAAVIHQYGLIELGGQGELASSVEVAKLGSEIELSGQGELATSVEVAKLGGEICVAHVGKSLLLLGKKQEVLLSPSRF